MQSLLNGGNDLNLVQPRPIRILPTSTIDSPPPLTFGPLPPNLSTPAFVVVLLSVLWILCLRYEACFELRRTQLFPRSTAKKHCGDVMLTVSLWYVERKESGSAPIKVAQGLGDVGVLADRMEMAWRQLLSHACDKCTVVITSPCGASYARF